MSHGPKREDKPKRDPVASIKACMGAPRRTEDDSYSTDILRATTQGVTIDLASALKNLNESE